MICGGIFLGVLGGLLIGKLIRRARYGRCGGGWHHGGHGLWAAGGGWQGRGRWGHGPGFPGDMAVRFVAQRLQLDPVQEAEVQAIYMDLKESVGDLRTGGRGWLDTAVESLAADSFDRARVEAAAAEQAQHVDGLKGKLVDAVQKLHDILTPAQRQKLVAMRNSFRGRWGGGPSAGPYR